MTKIKVVTIGGGSSYTPELIEGFIKKYHEFPMTEYWLVDIELGKEKCEIIYEMTKRMFKQAGLNVDVHWTLNRRDALKDADFVTTQFRVGGLDCRDLDETIPLKYGVMGQETNGPGGMFKALRTIPVIFDIIKDCQELCPNAWIISFTNPSGINAEAVFRYTGWKKFIGLCNCPIGMIKSYRELLTGNKDDNSVDVTIAGINHMIFATSIKKNGKEVREELIKKLTDNTISENLKNIYDIPYTPEFIRGLKYPGCGYLRYYVKKSEMLDHLNIDAIEGKNRAKVVKGVEQDLFEKYKDSNLCVKPKELELRGGAYYSDAACNLITSIYNDKQDVQVVDTLNNGAISNLPNDVVVEVSSVITKDGPKPVHIGDLPWEVVGYVQALKAYEVLLTNVAVSGNYDDALYCMTLNPQVQSEAKARLILDDMLEAHKDYLPEFKNYFTNRK